MYTNDPDFLILEQLIILTDPAHILILFYIIPAIVLIIAGGYKCYKKI
jgi:hypothetical protein